MGECVNVKNGKAFFDLKPEVLKCIPHCPKYNENNPRIPIRYYNWDACGKLAFRKEAMLAGISQDNETEVFAKGKKLFENKHANG